MMYPVDNTYWTKLKAFVDYEPTSAVDTGEPGWAKCSRGYKVFAM